MTEKEKQKIMRKEQGKCFIFLQFILNLHETNRSKSLEQSWRQRLDYSFSKIVCLCHFLNNKSGSASIKLRKKGRKNDDSFPPSYNLKNHHFSHMQPRFCIDFRFFVSLIHHFTIYNWSFDYMQNFHFCSLWTPIFAPSSAPCPIECQSRAWSGYVS